VPIAAPTFAARAAVDIDKAAAATSSSTRTHALNINDSLCAFCFQWRLMGVMLSHSR
jgi:hypothetical protein